MSDKACNYTQLYHLKLQFNILSRVWPEEHLDKTPLRKPPAPSRSACDGSVGGTLSSESKSRYGVGNIILQRMLVVLCVKCKTELLTTCGHYKSHGTFIKGAGVNPVALAKFQSG